MASLQSSTDGSQMSDELLLHRVMQIHSSISKLNCLRPSKQVNSLFTQLVKLCTLPSSIDITSLPPEVQSVRESLIILCGRAEGLLEFHFANFLITILRPLDHLDVFPYYVNYVKLASLEYRILHDNGVVAPKKVAFVGSGPMPLTSFFLATHHLRTTYFVNFDIDKLANDVAHQIVASDADMESRMEFETCGIMEVKDRLAEFDCIFVAALVGMYKKDKAKILRHIRKYMKPGGTLLVRSAAGARAFLYPVVDEDDLIGFDILSIIHPTNDVINSVVLLRKPLSSTEAPFAHDIDPPPNQGQNFPVSGHEARMANFRRNQEIFPALPYIPKITIQELFHFIQIAQFRSNAKRNNQFHNQQLPPPPQSMGTTSRRSPGIPSNRGNRGRGRSSAANRAKGKMATVEEEVTSPPQKRRSGIHIAETSEAAYVPLQPNYEPPMGEIMDLIKQPPVANHPTVHRNINPNAFSNMGNNWNIENPNNIDELQLLGAQIQGLPYQNIQLQFGESNGPAPANLLEPTENQYETFDQNGGIEARAGNLGNVNQYNQSNVMPNSDTSAPEPSHIHLFWGDLRFAPLSSLPFAEQSLSPNFDQFPPRSKSAIQHSVNPR